MAAAAVAPWDPLLLRIADYARDHVVDSPPALDSARACLADSLGRAFAALAHQDCARLLGPVVPGATMLGGARVPGTSYELDPVKAAFDLGAMIGWLPFGDDGDDGDAVDDGDRSDFGDAGGRGDQAERGSPAPALGGLLVAADWSSRRRVLEGGAALTVRDLLVATVKVCEIHGVLAAGNQLAARGCDPVLWVRVATAAVVTALLGGTRGQVAGALANAFVDGAPLGASRPMPAVGARARWAAGDAAARGVRLALLALAGQTGPPAALTAPHCGFEAVVLGEALDGDRAFGAALIDGWRPVSGPGFDAAVTAHYAPRQAKAILALFADPVRLDALPVPAFVSALARP